MFLLDCDTGIDDAVALLYLLSDPKVRVVGVTTTFGNCAAAEAADNTLRILHRIGRPDIPVAVGANHPLRGTFDGGEAAVHGKGGLGGVELDVCPTRALEVAAPDFIVQLARANVGRLHIIATGTLTNLALALEIEPRLPAMVASLTIMGGAASVPGNVSPVAEANVSRDPEAAAKVLSASWTVTLVPLDVTMLDIIEEADRQVLLGAKGTAGELAARVLEFYMGFYKSVYGRPAAPCHDALAVAIAKGDVLPTLAPVLAVEVDTTDGPGRGQTICDLRGRFRGYPLQPNARSRVVLQLPGPFTPKLVASLISFRLPCLERAPGFRL
jgi:purine nucleosidase